MSKHPDKLVFFSRSVRCKPGKGIDEHVSEEYDLPTDFRQRLSNFYDGYGPFLYDSAGYRTIEHAFHAMKFKFAGHKDIAMKFQIGNEWGRGDGHEAKAHRKAVNLTQKQRLDWDKISMHVMVSITTAFYRQKPAALDFLKRTRKAQLWHVVSRSKDRIRWIHLEQIRDGILQ